MATAGTLLVDGWAGRVRTPVVVVGQTPTRLRIRAITETKLPRRWLAPGELAWVPRTAVRLAQEAV